MAEPTLLSMIQNQIAERYGSLNSPAFFFVEEQLRKEPYAALIMELAGRFAVRDVTDPNEDVSFNYEVLDGDQQVWRLELSMIGPYAFVVNATEKCDQEEREFLNRVLARFHITELDQSVLETPIALKLHYTEPEDVSLYHALFSDSLAPWETS